MDLKKPGWLCVPPSASHPHMPRLHQWTPCHFANFQKQIWHFPWSHSTADRVFLSCLNPMHKRIAMSQIDYMIVINSYYDAADVDQQLLERMDLFLSSFFTYILLPGMRVCQGSAGRMSSDRFSIMFYPLQGYFYRMSRCWTASSWPAPSLWTASSTSWHHTQRLEGWTFEC